MAANISEKSAWDKPHPRVGYFVLVLLMGRFCICQKCRGSWEGVHALFIVVGGAS